MKYYYIPLAHESKRPVLEWDGWPIDPKHPNIFTKEQALEADWEYWAIVSVETKNLLVIDVDWYKMNDDEKEQIHDGWDGLLDQTRIVKTQSGGLHVYFLYDGDRLPRSIDYVDIKGDVGKGYVVSPISPDYTIQNDKEPFPITESQIEDLPVFDELEDENDTPDGTTNLPTETMQYPPCFPKAVQAMGSDSAEAARFVRDFLSALGKDTDFIESIFQDNYPNFEPDVLRRLGGSDVNVFDVLPRGKFPEGERVEHPNFLHSSPSESKANFMVDEGGETFRCWRHDVTGNALHLIGVKAGIIDCEDWKYGLSSETWRDIFEEVEDRGYELPNSFVDCDTIDQNGLCPYDCGRNFPTQNVL